jgi:hypothetical protein
LINVGARRGSGLTVTPRGGGWPPANANSERWQDAHDTIPSTERRASKNRNRPNATRASEYGLSAGQGTGGNPSGGLGGDCASSFPVIAIQRITRKTVGRGMGQFYNEDAAALASSALGGLVAAQ